MKTHSVFLAPSDAPTALARRCQRLVVWDPYLALAQRKLNGLVIAAPRPDIKSNTLVARRGFASEHPETLRDVHPARHDGAWAQSHRDETAEQLAEITGIVSTSSVSPRAGHYDHASVGSRRPAAAGCRRPVLQAGRHSEGRHGAGRCVNLQGYDDGRPGCTSHRTDVPRRIGVASCADR